MTMTVSPAAVPEAAADASVVQAQAQTLEDLARRSRVGTTAYTALWLLVVASTSYLGDHPEVGYSLGAIFVILGVLRLMQAHDLRIAAPGHARRWQLWFRIGALLSAGTWSVFCAHVLIGYGLQPISLLVLFGTAGISAGASDALAPDLRLAVAYLASLLVPVTITLLFLGEPTAYAAACMLAIYLLFMVSIVRRIHHEYWSRLRANALLDRQVLELQQARDAALAAARVKDCILANLGHEVRTPLNGMLGMLELLRAGPLNDLQSRQATTAFASGERLLRLLVCRFILFGT